MFYKVAVWPNGTWCDYNELYTYAHMSDDFRIEELSELEYEDLCNGDLVL